MKDREQEWLDRIGNGDFSAFRLLMERYQAKLYDLAVQMLGNREDAEDAVQESFVKIYQALPRFRRQSGLNTWMYRIVVNTCTDLLRKRKRRLPLDDSYSLEGQVSARFSPGHEDPEKNAEAEDFARLFRKAVAELSPRERAVVVLRHMEELPLQEIGRVLGLSTGTVKSLHFRAIRKLRMSLRRLGFEESEVP